MMMTKVLLNPSRRFLATLSSPPRYFSTAATAEQAATTDKGKVVKKTDALYNTLTASKLTENSTRKQLDLYFGENNLGIKFELNNCIHQLRRNKKSEQALEVMEWMHARSVKFGPTDHANELHLISKVKGFHAAEHYFNALPESAKDKFTYGSMLHWYCREKLTDDAQALFEKMDKMQFVGPFAFNNLLSLYITNLMPEKVPPLVQEMKSKNIPLTAQTYNIWITSYSRLNDIDGVEKVFEEMRFNNVEVQYEWSMYHSLAEAYVKAGHYEKAESILKTIEDENGKMGSRCQTKLYHRLYHSLAEAYVKAGHYEKAESILKTIEEEIGKMWSRCTITEQAATEQTATTDKGKVVKKTDALYNTLTASKLTGNSTRKQLDLCYGEKNLGGIKYELNNCIQQLRCNKNYEQALEVMEWMHTRSIKFRPTDHASELHLISKVKGIHAAEHYFNALPESAKDKFTYGCMLHWYCREKLTDDAQALFEKMEKMQFVGPFAFNNLLSLYITNLMPEKVPPLVQEMKSKNIPLTAQTYNIWITSYSRLNDIDGVEKVFEEMRFNNVEVQYEWLMYHSLAEAYVKAGHYEKAESILKTIEEEIGKMGSRCRPILYHHLIRLYAETSNLAQVHNIWKRLKSTFEITSNDSTLRMLSSLAKLDDVKGFKKIFDEWESSQSTSAMYDKRLLNLAVLFYENHDMIDEAVNVFSNVLKRPGKKFCNFLKNVRSGDPYSYYIDKNQIDFAWRYLEAAIPVIKNTDWQLTPTVVKQFMWHFKKRCDVNSAEKFCKLLKNMNELNSDTYKLLLETYVASGKTEAEICQRIIDDGMKSSLGRIEKLLLEAYVASGKTEAEMRQRIMNDGLDKLILEADLALSKTAPEMHVRIINDDIKISPELEKLLGRVCTE